jgi:hypothetical protein
MNGAERDTVVGSGSLVTLDPGAKPNVRSRVLFRSDRGHYRRREAPDPHSEAAVLSMLKARQAFPEIGRQVVDANKRRFGLRDGGVGPVARCQTHQLHPSCGTE